MSKYIKTCMCCSYNKIIKVLRNTDYLGNVCESLTFIEQLLCSRHCSKCSFNYWYRITIYQPKTGLERLNNFPVWHRDSVTEQDFIPGLSSSIAWSFNAWAMLWFENANFLTPLDMHSQRGGYGPEGEAKISSRGRGINNLYSFCE